MRLLVSGATVRRLAPECGDVLGCLAVPGAKNDPATVAAMGLPVAADNGAYSGLDAGGFARMLAEYREAGVKLEWVAVPDAVADAEETFRLWGRWEPVVLAFGFRPALVLQDGMTIEDMFVLKPPAVFVGGSTEWKLGPAARKCVAWAVKEGRPAHMGRVNTARRIRYAADIGCTSFDGSGFSKWPDIRIPKGVRWARKFKTNLFAGVPTP